MDDMCQVKCVDKKKVTHTLESMPDKDIIAGMADIFKVLSDPSRLKIVLALLQCELCVCDIAAVCGQTDSAVSHQLRLLRTLKIVKNRREGKSVFYTIDDSHVSALITMSLKHVQH